MLISYDIETSGLSPYTTDNMFGFSTCTPDGTTQVRRLDLSPKHNQRSMDILSRMWDDPHAVIPIHNAKFDLSFTKKLLGRDPAGKLHCTLIMSWMLMNLRRGHALKPLCHDLCGFPVDDKEDLRGYESFQDIHPDLMNVYMARDAQRHLVLYQILKDDIFNDPGTKDCYEVEMEVMPHIMEAESRGILLDKPATKQLIVELKHNMVDCQRRVEELMGYEINPGSPNQLRKVLFEDLGLPSGEKTPSGQLSTGKEELMVLRGKHPLVELIIEYRSWEHGIPILRNYMRFAEHDGCVHSSIQSFGAATGRMACSSPNLMNVSKEDVLLNPYPVPARRCFVARPGHTLYFFDYGGQELRFLVHYHKDPEFLQIFKDGRDAHKEAAHTLYDREDITKKYRDAAKNANYGIGYGAGYKRLAGIINVPKDVAQTRLANYHRRFPRTKEWPKEIIQQVREIGYVTTEFSRRINVDQNKPFEGTNFLIQGTGADMIKRALIKIRKAIPASDAPFILPVHDELIFEISDDMLEKRRRDLLLEIKRHMEDFPRFSVPMIVECSSGKRWSEKTKMAF